MAIPQDRCGAAPLERPCALDPCDRCLSHAKKVCWKTLTTVQASKLIVAFRGGPIMNRNLVAASLGLVLLAAVASAVLAANPAPATPPAPAPAAAQAPAPAPVPAPAPAAAQPPLPP